MCLWWAEPFLFVKYIARFGRGNDRLWSGQFACIRNVCVQCTVRKKKKNVYSFSSAHNYGIHNICYSCINHIQTKFLSKTAEMSCSTILWMTILSTLECLLQGYSKNVLDSSLLQSLDFNFVFLLMSLLMLKSPKKSRKCHLPKKCTTKPLL